MPSAFWSTEVYPGKPAQIELGLDQLLHIGGACLGPPSRGGGEAGGDQQGRVWLSCATRGSGVGGGAGGDGGRGGKGGGAGDTSKAVLCVLSHAGQANVPLDVEFTGGIVALALQGSKTLSVHLYGRVYDFDPMLDENDDGEYGDEEEEEEQDEDDTRYSGFRMGGRRSLSAGGDDDDDEDEGGVDRNLNPTEGSDSGDSNSHNSNDDEEEDRRSPSAASSGKGKRSRHTSMESLMEEMEAQDEEEEEAPYVHPSQKRHRPIPKDDPDKATGDTVEAVVKKLLRDNGGILEVGTLSEHLREHYDVKFKKLKLGQLGKYLRGRSGAFNMRSGGMVTLAGGAAGGAGGAGGSSSGSPPKRS